MKDLVEKYFSTRRCFRLVEKYFPAIIIDMGVSEKWRKNGFH